MFINNVTPTTKWEGVTHNTASRDYRADRYDNSLVVIAHFPRYGGGEQRRTDFDIGVRWDDVVIQKFCEAGQPEAIALREAMTLAAAVKELGWQPPLAALPQSN